MVTISFRIVTLLLLAAMTASSQDESEKCGTIKYIRYLNNAKKYNAKMLAAVRPTLQKNILSASGKFRIHYDTSGIHQPAMTFETITKGVKTITRIPNSYDDYIDTLSVLLDSVWRAEVDAFGFEPPPGDNGRGGGSEYDFYVMNIGGGVFGETNIENDLPVGTVKSNQQYASFIRIENDFVGYRTTGIPAMMATIAHEFHHAIQIGGSGVWEEEQFYFYELCAESLENTVFKNAKDYILDVKTYFSNISSTPLFQQRVSFQTSGYERAIWGMYLIKKYGTTVMKEIWNEMKNNRPVPALNNALAKLATTVEREFADFTYWNYFTSYRADSVKYYSDAKQFPTVSIFQTMNIDQSIQTLSISAKSFTPHYIKVATPVDSAFIIVSNTDYQDALNYSQNNFHADIQSSSSSASGFPEISNSIFVKFTAMDLQHWSYIPIGISSPTICFPNPLNPDKSSLLISLHGIGADEEATLSIIEASTLDLVYSNRINFATYSGTQYAEWKGRDSEGNITPSGIYIYILSKGSTIVKGKFAIIR